MNADISERIELHNTDPRRRIGHVERGELLRKGLAWIDPDGALHPGQPDDDTFAEIFPAVEGSREVSRAHLAAMQAGSEVGRLLRELEAAEAAYYLAHAQMKIAAAAEWSKRNAAPHDAAHDARIRDYFARRPGPG